MSDKHDHKHDHDHDHGPGHKHGDIQLPLKDKPAPPPAPEPERVLEDAGAAALSETLRSSFAIVKVLMVLLVLAFFASGFFTVTSGERAIRLRFGKPVGKTPAEQLLGPGLKFGFPAPIDEVIKIPIGEYQIVRSTVGWYATSPEAEAAGAEPPPNMSLSPASDGYTITSDGNIIHVRAEVRYRVADPIRFVLGFTSSSNVVQNVVDEALFFTSSQFTADQALTTDREGFREKVLSRVRQRADELQLGITVDLGTVQVIPPRQTKTAFEAALTAEIERRQTNDVARAYAGRVQMAAEGDANSMLNSAQTDRTRLVQAVASEAQYFKFQLPEYQANPNLFVARVQNDVMSRVMTNVVKWYIPSPKAGTQRELRLQLNADPNKPPAPNQQQPPQSR